MHKHIQQQVQNEPAAEDSVFTEKSARVGHAPSPDNTLQQIGPHSPRRHPYTARKDGAWPSRRCKQKEIRRVMDTRRSPLTRTADAGDGKTG
jgi:hypothetical protein